MIYQAILSLLIISIALSKVDVDFYFEAYCPGCHQFYSQCLYPMMSEHSDIAENLNFKLWPFGNGHIISEDPPKFTCQHGPDECYMNTVETCAVAKFKQNQTLTFVNCLENSGDMKKEIEKCAIDSNIDFNILKECYEGPEGQLLLLDVAKSTPADHKFVPWLVIDGVAQEESYDQVVEVICEKLESKPESCKSYSCAGKLNSYREYNLIRPKSHKHGKKPKLGRNKKHGKHHHHHDE